MGHSILFLWAGLRTRPGQWNFWAGCRNDETHPTTRVYKLYCASWLNLPLLMRRLNLMRYFCEYIQYMYFWKDTNSQFFGHVKVWQTLFQTLESELERMVFNCFLDSLEKSFLIIAYEHPGIVDRMFRNWALSMDLSSELMDWVQLSSAIKRNRTLNQIESDSIEQIKLNSTQSNRLLDWIWQPNSIEHSPVDCGWWIN